MSERGATGSFVGGRRGAERRRFGAYALLYLAEGAPIGFLWWALPAAMRARGASVEGIATLLAVLALPWSLKFLWAPLVDALRGPRWSYRAWIVAAQVGMTATLVPLAWIEPENFVGGAAALLVAHAIFAATQDVAIDALAIANAPAGERGKLNAWMQAGMLTGRAAFGGGALLVREHLGDAAIVAMLALVLVGTLAVVARLEDPPVQQRERGRWSAFASDLALAARTRSTWIGLGFAATAGAGFEAVGALAGPLLVDLGASQERIGAFLAVVAVACTLAGGFAGGWAVDRFARRRALASSCAATAFAVLGVAGAARAGVGADTVMLALAAVYLGIGAMTASSYALFMDLTHPRLGSTQFSAYMGATNLCEAWSTFAAGRIAARGGYAASFAALGGLSLLAILWLAPLRARRSIETPAANRKEKRHDAATSFE